MGNYAFFSGCVSRESAVREARGFRDADRPGQPASQEPEVEAKYSLPLFWLAGFDADDLVTVQEHDDTSPGTLLYEYVVPCAAVRDYTARARRRRDAIVALLPAAIGQCYDEWIRFVERRYARHVMVRTADLFSMTDFEECSLRLRGGLRGLQAADRGERIVDTAALEWFCDFRDAFRERASGATAEDCAQGWRLRLSGYAWTTGANGVPLWPTKPTPAEVAFAASLPEAAAPAEPGTVAAEDEQLVAMIRSGMHGETHGARLRLALRQLGGEVPLGVDAPTRGLRKWIGGGGEVLVMVRDGLLGLVLVLLGAGFLWVGVGPPWYWQGAAIGVACTALGSWLLRSAWRAQRRLRTIVRA